MVEELMVSFKYLIPKYQVQQLAWAASLHDLDKFLSIKFFWSNL
jgi:hypothetical protein